MKKIGITQRVAYFDKINERRDMLDQAWMDFAKELGFHLIPIPNKTPNVIKFAESLGLSGIILSGGNNIGDLDQKKTTKVNTLVNDVAIERDKLECNLIKWVISNKKPLIGVCRGMQMINAYFKGLLINVDPQIHVAKKHQVVITNSQFENFYGKEIEVNSYHDYGIKTDGLAETLTELALYEDEVEAFRHKELPLYGIMWHPERYNTFLKQDINFFKSILNL